MCWHRRKPECLSVSSSTLLEALFIPWTRDFLPLISVSLSKHWFEAANHLLSAVWAGFHIYDSWSDRHVPWDEAFMHYSHEFLTDDSHFQTAELKQIIFMVLCEILNTRVVQGYCLLYNMDCACCVWLLYKGNKNKDTKWRTHLCSSFCINLLCFLVAFSFYVFNASSTLQ